tara:strand:+ start:4185 stop:4682 length:498 start_codon:yes stop_codon:yes gene_type:complete
MAVLTTTFNANEIEPAQTFDTIPAGKYPMIFTDSEERQTKAGTGSYYQFTSEIIDGKFKGRKIWIRLNIHNPNEKAVEIAKRELSSICRATGVMELNETSQLHNIPFLGSIKIKPAEGSYEASNEIKGYEALTGQPPAQQQPATASAPTLPIDLPAKENAWWDKK